MAEQNALSAFRAGFPALQDRTYLATAGGGPIASPAARAAEAYFRESEAQADAPFADWLVRTDVVRTQVADVINAAPTDIAFLASASVAMNAVTGYVAPEATIVTVADEFPSVVQPWVNRGHPVVEVGTQADGAIDLDRIVQHLTPDVGAIALSHVQFRTGRRIDLTPICKAAQAIGAMVIVDATQSMGAVPIDVTKQPVSILMASGYKWLCAGYGIAAVYVNPELRHRRPPVFGWRSAAVPYALIPTDVTPTDTAVQLEMGHPPFAPAFCLGGALSHAGRLDRLAIWQRIEVLQSYLRLRLAKSGLPSPLAPVGESGIAVLPTSRGAALKKALAEDRIMISASGNYVRLSTHAFNTEAEIDQTVDRLAQLW